MSSLESDADLFAPPGYLEKLTKLSRAPLSGVSDSFSHTDRDLDAYQNLLGFTPDSFPGASRILVIGSGATRLFEKQLAAERPDLSIISIDPLLRCGVEERIKEAGRKAGQHRANFANSGEDFYRPGAVCGAFVMRQTTSNYFPFRDKSFNAVLGLHSLPQWLLNAQIPPFVEDLARIMAPGAYASLYPMYNDQEYYLPDEKPLHITPIQIDRPEITYPDNPDPWTVQRMSFCRL
jgi:hypothetical protein